MYVTKNFFALLGAPEVDGSSLTVRTFGELLEHMQLARPCTVNAEGDKVLTVVQGGRTRYIMLRVTTCCSTAIPVGSSCAKSWKH